MAKKKSKKRQYRAATAQSHVRIGAETVEERLGLKEKDIPHLTDRQLRRAFDLTRESWDAVWAGVIEKEMHRRGMAIPSWGGKRRHGKPAPASQLASLAADINLLVKK